MILSYNPKCIADICCGSGAVTIELLNRGVDPSNILMVDAGPWGWFWRDVGAGEFDFALFESLWATMPRDPKLVASWVHKEIAMLPPSSVTFIILQAASFGSTPVWWDGKGWRRGEGNRKYKARSYWEPKATSKETKPRGTIFQPTEIPLRIQALMSSAKGIKGFASKAEVVDFMGVDIMYVDPPYGGTSGYGVDIDWRSLVGQCPVLVSEGVPLEGATKVVELASRKGASLNGKSSGNSSEWLSTYESVLTPGEQQALGRQPSSARLAKRSKCRSSQLT